MCDYMRHVVLDAGRIKYRLVIASLYMLQSITYFVCKPSSWVVCYRTPLTKETRARNFYFSSGVRVTISCTRRKSYRTKRREQP